ncbi:MAG: L-lactate permease, partial [Rhodanobacter sp.]
MTPTTVLPPGIVFTQPLTPIHGSLLFSFATAAIPIVVALFMLGVMRRPAWQASLAGLIAALVIAISLWGMPAGLAIDSVAAGMALALLPVMWIVFTALLLYNVAVKSGRFEQFRQWMLDHLPDDRRLVLLVVAFSFGCLLEGIAGFGTPVAITSALLIGLGFPAIEALTYT